MAAVDRRAPDRAAEREDARHEVDHSHDRSSDPPGAVSNQNGEEAESGLRDDATHPEPRTDHEPDEPGRPSP